jgi:hypothetical protein
MKKILSIIFCFCVLFSFGQENRNNSKFKQLKQELPTPNSYRNASGAPGHEYYQQRADYKMKLRIDDDKQQLHGDEMITYHNNSPDVLEYLWLQLDQNVRAKDSDSHKLRGSKIDDNTSLSSLARLDPSFEGGFNIDAVKASNGSALKYTINKTMMRIDLPKPLKKGEKFKFNIKWWYNINNTKEVRGRSGYEPFEEDGNNVYVIAQFFPRMCAYNDVEGWQNKQFLGRGEFALVFGDYDVEIEVPADHLVASTGELQNANKVLTANQKSRLAQAKRSHEQPVMIATMDEAEDRMKGKSDRTKTWNFKAENVRDFGFATSRRFMWDAMGVPMSDGRTVIAQSMWVKEGDCLWRKYSTKAVAHTVKWFSHYTFDYPYPVAWSIDGNMGMEYPMICFNFGRCEDDNTYTQRMKYGHIGVIIHEVGHNWFPMIVNSDERQWTWMDEGLCTFVQYLTEQHWERDYPSRRGPAHKITNYMGGDKSRISPIMTNSESIHQFGNNAYGKPATALNILRETVMGRELFDHAFKTYSNRWKFKSPSPADLFRTLEDASGVDLDWFWRGWFYTNDHCDQSLVSFKPFEVKSIDPRISMAEAKMKRDAGPVHIGTLRNREQITETLNEADPSINDFYTDYDPLESNAADDKEYEDYLESLSEQERKILESGKNFYELEIKNEGGLVMPVIFDFVYEDGTRETFRLPAEVWKTNEVNFTKVFSTDKKVVEVLLDPYLETADVDRSNNAYPPKEELDRFDMFQKNKKRTRENPMQRSNRAKEIEAGRS